MWNLESPQTFGPPRRFVRTFIFNLHFCNKIIWPMFLIHGLHVVPGLSRVGLRMRDRRTIDSGHTYFRTLQFPPRTQFPQNFVHKKGRLYRDLMAWTLYKYMFATQGNHADIFMLHLLYKQNSVIIVFHTVYQLTVVLYCDRWELRGLQLIHHMAPAQVSTKPISTWYPFGNN